MKPDPVTGTNCHLSAQLRTMVRMHKQSRTLGLVGYIQFKLVFHVGNLFSYNFLKLTVFQDRIRLCYI